jgi:hypothetical protein
MNPVEEHTVRLAEKILEAETRLANLRQDIEEIGHPANIELKRRYDALKIEEAALKRNFTEAGDRAESGLQRMEKIDALLQHIQREEGSVAHEAEFLRLANPSSMTVAVEGSVKAMEFVRDGVKKVMGGHHPLGESAFVNHTHENLVTEYGLEDEPSRPER